MESLKILVEKTPEMFSYAKVLKNDSIVLTALTREDCKSNPRLFKYFRNGNTELDRFHVPEITKEQYEAIAPEFAKSSRFNPVNLKWDTASDYYKRKARIAVVAKDLGVSPSKIDIRGYSWDERMYTVYSLMRNYDEVEEAYRNSGEDYREFSAWKVYIGMEAKQTVLDMNVYESLFRFCYTAISARKAMLLAKVDKCLGFLISLAEYTNGFSENCTGPQMAILKNYAKFFKDLYDNEEAKAWLASTNDIEVFGKNEATHNDYIETYRGMLKMLIRGGSIEYFRPIMSKVEDPYIEEILEDKDDYEELMSEAYLKHKSAEEVYED